MRDNNVHLANGKNREGNVCVVGLVAVGAIDYIVGRLTVGIRHTRNTKSPHEVISHLGWHSQWRLPRQRQNSLWLTAYNSLGTREPFIPSAKLGGIWADLGRTKQTVNVWKQQKCWFKCTTNVRLRSIFFLSFHYV